ncbi:MAG: ribbon-helix-helix domain-containing protein [Nitrosomonas sp.]|jgi:predicted transcriptional regulator|nr:ribbon-helix-helix domain-containing protein [Nitrosomonas sp.]
MTTLNIRLTEQIEQRLSEEAERENKTRSEIARDALNWYLTEIEKKRFMDQLLEEARTAYADNNIRQEALDIAEEFLSLDGEIPEKTDNSAPADPPNPEFSEKWWK